MGNGLFGVNNFVINIYQGLRIGRFVHHALFTRRDLIVMLCAVYYKLDRLLNPSIKWDTNGYPHVFLQITGVHQTPADFKL